MQATTDFGNVTLGQSATATYTVSADSSSSGMAVTVKLTGSSEFTLANPADAAFTIPNGQTHKVLVNFTPTADGVQTAQLDILYDNIDYRVPLSGIGGAKVEVQPAINFGALVNGQSVSATYTVTADQTSVGGMPVTVKVTGSSMFALVNPADAAFTVPPGQSHTITISFAPTGAGAQTGQLDLIFGNVDYQIPLSGTGEGPSCLAYGIPIPVGTTMTRYSPSTAPCGAVTLTCAAGFAATLTVPPNAIFYLENSPLAQPDSANSLTFTNHGDLHLDATLNPDNELYSFSRLSPTCN